MPGPKRIPVEVVERAQALTKQYTIATKPAAPAPEPKKKVAKAKVVAALKRLHPMD